MTTTDFSSTLLVDQRPETVFDAIKKVRGWWTENVEGNTEHLNDFFEVRFDDVHYSRQQLVELIPARKVVWLITDSRLSFISDKSEWTGTRVVFDITEQEGQTQLRFTHIGLKPEIECYGACSNAWSGYMRNSLFNLITKGEGQPAK
ncbi:SRPBCC domain-containing protein [Spirosoma sp. KNUC1025]|uniref:SRPBCC family protein n=1 Tax=Spirosoma sp. KNUC1025 TaxID=2894082 RepID=UPI00386C47F0|nr:SRPBCC domain-containing protein [Spirosoma sp. KNUC1025]